MRLCSTLPSCINVNASVCGPLEVLRTKNNPSCPPCCRSNASASYLPPQKKGGRKRRER
eukprot:m.153442 g.153442  ORF g.153442 m.153442 type:complete len:59 (-) comp24590_c0_seq2:283-459(-)